MADTDHRTVYLEDIEAQTTIDCGEITVSADDIIEFAEQFDPLEIHTDPETASESRYDGLIASGYHTLSLSVRLLVEEVRSERAVVAGLGIDDVRWHEPVRPGDTLAVETTVTETRPSESDPNTGIVRERISVTNQSGAEVLSLENHELVERRSSVT
ncbi:MaoC/PaaZ C-terminal domain-containing protein [Natrinema salsiterrestre]|uniref:MaoC family dehydratase N-terminal domain-containing protein n=1 Tax=Natrinema salsiterrestre TaxID=2950540 RepID=A0A9Q4L764_9EURY|nr:MaoC/PaaZ C-terminal domain-containing protein [Natrinema salsiterrestre]MDF9748519.1 MaoC family dehydratase N-terminal domain-containing protein [Natrinema salsiterrestre]